MKEITIFDNNLPDVSIKTLKDHNSVEDYVNSLKYCGFQEIQGKILVHPGQDGKIIKIILNK